MGDFVPERREEDYDECIVCEKDTMRKCAICNGAMICSMNCQQIALLDNVDSGHSAECFTDTTADMLYLDVLNNRLPMNARTIHDFHFTWFLKLTDRRKLLDIYATIIRKADVTPREMDVWVKEKKLFERIAMLFYNSSQLMSLEDLGWLKGTHLWTYGLSKTTQAAFEVIIFRQQRLQSQFRRA
ncbi:hypothetical protein K4K59_008597 [Colletotrichum sp. SAR11_240]|nr:hypothetical protein K4K59_008597 [Colletotrichum sp. SAR11_240]